MGQPAAYKIKKRLEKIMEDAEKAELILFAHYDGYICIVDKYTYDACDDLRTIKNCLTVDMDTCGTPVDSECDEFGTH
jgi:hypothetical protein